LTISTSLAQNSYPTAQVIKGDTVILITPLQLKFVNRKILTVNYLTKANKGLSEANVTLSKEVDLQIAKGSSLLTQIESYKISSQAYSKLIEDKQKEILFNQKQSKKKKRKATLVSLGIGVIAGLILSIFI